MAPLYRPPKPTGTSRFIFFCQAIWEYLFNGGFPFVDTDTVKVDRGPNGYAFKAFLPAAGGGKGKTVDANYKLMAIKTLGSSLSPTLPELLVCSSVTMVNGAASIATDTIYVAKRREMRRINTEFFSDSGANVVQSYTYFGPTSNDASYGDNFRLAADGVNSELESAVPRYYTSAMLLAAPSGGKAIPADQSFITVVDLGVPTGIKDPSNNDVTKIEVTPRFWSKVVNA